MYSINREFSGKMIFCPQCLEAEGISENDETNAQILPSFLAQSTLVFQISLNFHENCRQFF